MPFEDNAEDQVTVWNTDFFRMRPSSPNNWIARNFDLSVATMIESRNGWLQNHSSFIAMVLTQKAWSLSTENISRNFCRL